LSIKLLNGSALSAITLGMSKNTPLQILIRRSGITQRELAHRMCCSYPAIANWTTGRQRVPPGRLDQMAGALGCTVDLLLQALPKADADDIEHV
jgi:transcriptional regulator with XRE-family HTH domain